MGKHWKIFDKWRDECNIYELNMKRKYCMYLGAFLAILGLSVFTLALYVYAKTGLVGLPVLAGLYSVIAFMFGVSFISDRNNISQLIYLKRFNGEKQ